MAKRKRTNNDIQNITQKTKDRATQTPLKTEDELRYYWIITIAVLLVAPVMLWLRNICVVIFDTNIPYRLTRSWWQWKNLHSDDFNINTTNHWFSSFLVSSKLISRKSWWEPQGLEYWINWKIYTPYAGTAGMLLHINRKFTIGKLKSSLLS